MSAMKDRKDWFLLICLLVILFTGCASTPKRNPLPVEFEGMAKISGISSEARAWGDETPEVIENWNSLSREELKTKYSGITGRKHAYLAISGGGANGAFGAGLLAGWTAAGTRPEFTMVTGISTGALIAPCAFLGSDYDYIIKKIYTTYSTEDLIKKRGMIATLTGISAATTEGLQAKIAEYYNQTIIDAIAAEYRQGRQLLIGTTDLDAGRPVIWDIGQIAASDNPERIELIHKVLLASASIPGVFPPVFFEVEHAGKNYDELHVDGGATAQLFLYPSVLNWKMVSSKLEIKGRPDVFVIRNSRLDPERKVIKPKTMSILMHSVSSLIRTQGIGDLYQMATLAKRDGLNFYLAYIPGEFNHKPKEMFDPEYMVKLYDLGFRLAKEGNLWVDVLKELESN